MSMLVAQSTDLTRRALACSDQADESRFSCPGRASWPIPGRTPFAQIGVHRARRIVPVPSAWRRAGRVPSCWRSPGFAVAQCIVWAVVAAAWRGYERAGILLGVVDDVAGSLASVVDTEWCRVYATARR